MNRRTFMKIGLMAGVGLMLPRSVFGETPPPPQGNDLPNILKHRPTNADRQAAAQNMRQMGLLPGAAGATNIVNIPGLPHYFGPYPNYANSPMPKGVDTHPIHFHIANVQIINRVAWDNALIPTEPLELGWKETVRVNPLEHCHGAPKGGIVMNEGIQE